MEEKNYRSMLIGIILLCGIQTLHAQEPTVPEVKELQIIHAPKPIPYMQARKPVDPFYGKHRMVKEASYQHTHKNDPYWYASRCSASKRQKHPSDYGDSKWATRSTIEVLFRMYDWMPERYDSRYRAI